MKGLRWTWVGVYERRHLKMGAEGRKTARRVMAGAVVSALMAGSVAAQGTGGMRGDGSVGGGSGSGAWPGATPYSLALAAGASHWSAPCGQAMVCDRNATSYRLTGAWLFAPQAGLEVFYADEGDVKARAMVGTPEAVLQTTRLRVRGGGLGVAWWMPLDTQWKGVARAGLVYHRVRFDENQDSAADPSLLASSQTHGEVDPTVGVGISYRLTPQVQLDGRFDWTQTRLRPQSSSLIGEGTRGAHHWSVGVTYGF